MTGASTFSASIRTRDAGAYPSGRSPADGVGAATVRPRSAETAPAGWGGPDDTSAPFRIMARPVSRTSASAPTAGGP